MSLRHLPNQSKLLEITVLVKRDSSPDLLDFLVLIVDCNRNLFEPFLREALQTIHVLQDQLQCLYGLQFGLPVTFFETSLQLADLYGAFFQCRLAVFVKFFYKV